MELKSSYIEQRVPSNMKLLFFGNKVLVTSNKRHIKLFPLTKGDNIKGTGTKIII